MKEIARWSRDEVAALLRAWREGLEHQPNPLRRGKLNGFVSERFHALRACYEPFRTACSIVYKKKYWKSMVQFICEYQEQSGDWFALSPAERKRCFGELKTTSYKFTDLEQDTAFEIAQLITLEDGTPGLADLVYVHSGGRHLHRGLDLDLDRSDHYGGGSSASDTGGGGEYSPGMWGASPRIRAPPRLALEHHGGDDDDDENDDDDDGRHHSHLMSTFMRGNAPPPPLQKRGYRYGDYHDDTSVTSSGEEGSEHRRHDGGDGRDELAYRPQSASSTPRGTELSPLAAREFDDHPLLPASVSRYHQQREEVDDDDAVAEVAEHSQYTTIPLHSATTTTTSPDLLTAISRLERQAQQLKDMVQQERTERRRVRAQQEAQQQAWEAEQEQHKKLLEALKGSQLESQESDRAKQAQHDEWVKVLQQLQLDRQERIQAQSARVADESERQTLLEEIRLSQRERQKMVDEWKVEQEERAAILDQIRQERLARSQENAQWRALLAQLKAENTASDSKALPSVRHPESEATRVVREESKHEKNQPVKQDASSSETGNVSSKSAQHDPTQTAPMTGVSASALVPITPIPVAGSVVTSKQESRAGASSVRAPVKRSRPPETAEDESRPRANRVPRRV